MSLNLSGNTQTTVSRSDRVDSASHGSSKTSVRDPVLARPGAYGRGESADEYPEKQVIDWAQKITLL